MPHTPQTPSADTTGTLTREIVADTTGPIYLRMGAHGAHTVHVLTEPSITRAQITVTAADHTAAPLLDDITVKETTDDGQATLEIKVVAAHTSTYVAGSDAHNGDTGIMSTTRALLGVGDHTVVQSGPPKMLIEVKLPQGSSLNIGTFSSQITVAGQNTGLTQVHIASMSGDVRVSEAEDLDVFTYSGNIHAEQVTGTLNIFSGAGDVTVGEYSGRQGEVFTHAGDVRIPKTLMPEAQGTVKVHSEAGTVSV